MQQDRIVYLVKSLSNGRIVDGVGRTLTNRKPKWRRYGDNKTPFVCGKGDNVIVVEDCPSACCVWTDNWTSFDGNDIARRVHRCDKKL